MEISKLINSSFNSLQSATKCQLVLNELKEQYQNQRTRQANLSEQDYTERMAKIDTQYEQNIKESEKNKAEQIPPKRTDDNFEEKAFDYMYAKLDSLGYSIDKVDIGKLSNIYLYTDWDMDDDFDSTISKNEADKFYNAEYANQYMNKDKNGKIIDTHVLDWIVNNYLDNSK